MWFRFVLVSLLVPPPHPPLGCLMHTGDMQQIRDGQYGFSTLIGKYCGTDFPPEITSKERYLWLHFHSDDTIEYTGFSAVYEYLDRNREAPSTDLNCTIEKDGYEGFINSTDVPTEIREQVIRDKIALDCIWRIQVKDNWKVCPERERARERGVSARVSLNHLCLLYLPDRYFWNFSTFIWANPTTARRTSWTFFPSRRWCRWGEYEYGQGIQGGEGAWLGWAQTNFRSASEVSRKANVTLPRSKQAVLNFNLLPSEKQIWCQRKLRRRLWLTASGIGIGAAQGGGRKGEVMTRATHIGHILHSCASCDAHNEISTCCCHCAWTGSAPPAWGGGQWAVGSGHSTWLTDAASMRCDSIWVRPRIASARLVSSGLVSSGLDWTRLSACGWLSLPCPDPHWHWHCNWPTIGHSVCPACLLVFLPLKNCCNNLVNVLARQHV